MKGVEFSTEELWTVMEVSVSHRRKLLRKSVYVLLQTLSDKFSSYQLKKSCGANFGGEDLVTRQAARSGRPSPLVLVPEIVDHVHGMILAY